MSVFNELPLFFTRIYGISVSPSDAYYCIVLPHGLVGLANASLI
jgi:hypothetical protein